MGSSEEMYQRGVHDAEHDELNQFYYQHYYHYRRGYDQARRRTRRAAFTTSERRGVPASVPLLIIALIIGMVSGWYFWRPDSAPSTVSISSPQSVSAAPGALSPTARSRPTRTPTPSPTSTLAGLRTGSSVIVSNLNGAPLRARRGPGIAEPVQVRIPEGTRAVIIDGPVEADGYIWWLIDNNGSGGWSAERSPEGIVWLEPTP